MTVSVNPQDGKRALRDHVAERARLYRYEAGGHVGKAEFTALLENREFVRYPVELCFDEDVLKPGEIAWAEPLGPHPSAGFKLHVHPAFRDHEHSMLVAAAYQLVVVNYGDIAGPDEAEVFGAALLGLDVEDYYGQLCQLSDLVNPTVEGKPEPTPAAQPPGSGCGGCCDGGCNRG